jgi:hypothetical protein
MLPNVVRRQSFSLVMDVRTGTDSREHRVIVIVSFYQ